MEEGKEEGKKGSENRVNESIMTKPYRDYAIYGADQSIHILHGRQWLAMHWR